MTQTGMEIATAWKVSPGRVRIEALGEDQFAVFNADYWDSSVLNLVDASLLRTLVESGPTAISEDQLVDRVARDLDLAVDESLLAYARQALVQMAHVGLIDQERRV